MNVNLVLFKKNGSTQTFPLSQTVTIVGRQQHCDLCIPLMVVSRKHCELNQDSGVLRVRDLGSRNGTSVNGKKVTEAVLEAGDKLQLGPVLFAVQIDGHPAEFAAGGSDTAAAAVSSDDTSVNEDSNDAVLDGDDLETFHQREADIDDDEGEFFDDLLDGLEEGRAT